MGKLQSILTTRCREVYVKMSLLLLLGMTTAPTFGQCPVPTDCPATYSQTINLDALPICGQGTIGVRGDIGNAMQQTTCLNGSLRCFEFIFHRNDATTAESLTFPIGQGAGCNGETDAIYTSINGTCSQVWSGGSNANVTLTFPIGTTDIKLYGCLNSASFIAICDLCRTPSCTPAVTCPNLNPTAVACASAIPAPATDAASFVALGGGAAITNCGQSVSVTSTDAVSPASTCAARTLTRTYTITIGTYVQTCTVAYPILAPVTTFSSCPGAVTVSCVANVPPVNTTITATDNCGGTATVTANDVISAQTCANRYTLTRTYTATNACGVAATCVQTITVNDQTAPVLTGTAILPNIACGATLPTATELAYSATDACAGNVTVSASAWVLDATSTVCTGSLYKRIWTATDVCGNVSTREQTIQMNPPAVPTMTAPANITGICGSLPAPTRITFSNGATGTCLLTGLSAFSTFSTVPACAGTVVETWTMPASAATCNQALQSVSRTITCNAGLSCATTKVKDANCDGFNGSATVTLTGGVASTYKWDNNETTATATALNQGLHSVTVTSTAGCITICTVMIGNTTNLECSVVANGAASCKGANGSATVTATGGTSNIRFVWDNGETTATATQLTAGTHTVQTISGNCRKTCSVVIGTTGKNLYCSTTQTQTTATVVIIGGTGAVTILWDNGETTATAIRLTPGVHSVVLTDQAGCTTGCSVTIAGDALACTTSLVKHLKCSKDTDGSAKVTVTGGTAPYKILWDNGETTAIATNLSIGVHSVTVTDKSGQTTTCSISIGCTAAELTMTACTKTDVTCKGENTGSVTAGTVQGTGHFQYTWKNSSNKVVGTKATVQNLPAGTYTLIVQNDCSSATCDVTVLQPTEVCEKKEYHFYPAATTCCTYTNGSSQPLKFIGYKSNEHVTEVNPNVFYYYAKIVAPSQDFTVNVVQTKDESSFKFLGLSNDQIQLWDATCSKSVKGFATGNGQGKVSIKNAKIGATYVLAVRLDTRTLLKMACKKEAPKVTYTFASYINNVMVSGSKGSIQLKPNHQQVHLNAGKCSKYAPEQDSSEESLLNNTILVQPNPAQSAVNVVFESVSAETSVISVANVNGAIVQTLNHEAKQGENNVSLDIQNLPVGTYIVTVQTAHQWMTKQLVILR